MSLPIVLRAEASQDAEQSRDYLELQQQGLGQAFLNQLKETLARISNMPGISRVAGFIPAGLLGPPG